MTDLKRINWMMAAVIDGMTAEEFGVDGPEEEETWASLVADVGLAKSLGQTPMPSRD